jgi:citrate lyase subunit beta / citryl-CoA lyase
MKHSDETRVTTIAPIVTALYVPGDRPERFAKAVATGAHLVIVDLEDAVPPERKDEARQHVVDWLASPRVKSPVVEVRVNAGSADDLAALATVGGGFGVRMPKVESPGAVEAALVALGYTPRIAAVVETAAGVESLPAIAAHPAVRTLSLGEADLASDLGTADERALDWARLRLLYAARAHGKPAPMMSIYPDIRDRAMGFVGRTAIHPSQLPVIAAAFTPSDEEVAWAREVLAATADGGVTTLGSGEMADPAMRRRAETILALATATGSRA